MAKRNVKKIISVLAAVTIAASQFMLSAPMVSAVPINGAVYVDATNVNLKDWSVTKTSSESKTVAFDSTLTGSFVVSFELTVDSIIADNSFTLTCNGSNKVSGFLKLGAYDATQNAYPVIWNEKSDTEMGASVEVGKKYKYDMIYSHVGDGTGAAAKLVVTDENGNTIVERDQLPCRNFSDITNGAANAGFAQIVMTLAAKDANTPASIKLENGQTFAMGPTDINVTVASADVEEAAEGSEEPEIVTKTDILLNAAGNDVFSVPAAGAVYSLASDITKYGVVYGIKEDIPGISVSGNELIILSKAPGGKTTFTLTAAIEGSESSTADMQITINKEAASAEDVVSDAVKALTISDTTGKVFQLDASGNSKGTFTTTADLVLPQSDDYVTITWEVFAKEGNDWVETDVIDTETGKYTVTEGFSGKLKLVATVMSKDGSASAEKTFLVNISNPDDQLQLDLEELREYMEDYEKVTKDFELPKKGTYASTITWTSSSPSIISTKGEVTRQSTDKTVTLTATLENGGEVVKEKFDVLVEKKKTTSGGGGGSSSNSASRNTGGDSYKFYTPVTTTLINPVQSADPNAVPNKTNQAQNLDKVGATSLKFTDLNGVDWAVEAINNLAERGIISGKSDGIFAPNDNITRAEFAKILVNTLNLTDPNAQTSDFSDVKESDWYYSAVASAFRKGVITGYGDGRFGVNDNISRQDMAVLLYRAAKAMNYTLPIVAEEVKFTDEDQIDDYAKEAVNALQRARIITGVSDTEFAPKATASRAVAAKMIYGIYNLQ
ncbi:MAG: S-layer homology domain-containing protein [Oscillospiraceae bacterium]|nr:S-layer homology domain-containing protein [Oscillospiraceae bacterium]